MVQLVGEALGSGVDVSVDMSSRMWIRLESVEEIGWVEEDLLMLLK